MLPLQFLDISPVLQNSGKCSGRIPSRFFSTRRSFSIAPVVNFRGDTSIACGCPRTATLPTPASPRTTLLIDAVRRRRYPRNGEGGGFAGDGDSTRGGGDGTRGDGNNNWSATAENHFANVADFSNLFLFLPLSVPISPFALMFRGNKDTKTNLPDHFLTFCKIAVC